MLDLTFAILAILVVATASIVIAIRRQEKKRQEVVAFHNTFGTNPPQKGASRREIELLQATAREKIKDLFQRAEALRNDIQEATDVDNVRMLQRMEIGFNEEAADIFALAVKFGIVDTKSTILDLVDPD
jgi:hypothetical protein